MVYIKAITANDRYHLSMAFNKHISSDDYFPVDIQPGKRPAVRVSDLKKKIYMRVLSLKQILDSVESIAELAYIPLGNGYTYNYSYLMYKMCIALEYVYSKGGIDAYAKLAKLFNPRELIFNSSNMLLRVFLFDQLNHYEVTQSYDPLALFKLNDILKWATDLELDFEINNYHPLYLAFHDRNIFNRLVGFGFDVNHITKSGKSLIWDLVAGYCNDNKLDGISNSDIKPLDIINELISYGADITKGRLYDLFSSINGECDCDVSFSETEEYDCDSGVDNTFCLGHFDPYIPIYDILVNNGIIGDFETQLGKGYERRDMVFGRYYEHNLNKPSLLEFAFRSIERNNISMRYVPEDLIIKHVKRI